MLGPIFQAQGYTQPPFVQFSAKGQYAFRDLERICDDLVILSTVEEIRAASVLIQQRVIRGEELLTDARVTAAFLDANGRPQRQPKSWVEKFREIANQS